MEDYTMKKVFGIAALLLALAVCNKVETEITPVEQPSDSKGITITATLAPKTADTKAVADGGDKITVSWAQNEVLAILYEVGGTQYVADATITAVDGTTGAATIEFTVVDGTADNTACTLVYPAKLSDGTTTVYNDAKTGVKDAATLLAVQDGTLSANLDVRVGAGTIQTTTPSLNVTTQPAAQFAIFKFTLSGVSIDNTHPLVIKDNASNTTITTVKPASTATSVFVAMPAAASKTYKFVVATADNKYIKSGTATIAAGNYYQTTLSMTTPRYPLALSNATADDLGAVVNSEGQMSVEKAAASGTAVGIVGKVTETGHGLILALKDATSQNWNTINGWTSVTTYAGTTLKVLPDDAARGTNLTSYTALGTTAVSNWAVAQKSDYEAIFINLGSTKSDEDGYTFDGNVNAYITTGVGGTAISGDYWSATVKDVDIAWDFFSDFWDYSDKEESYSVRPVLGFGGDAAPAGPIAYTLAESTVGMIVGTDGKAYAVEDKDNLPTGVTAVAMVAYKSGSNGLAIQLNSDPEKMNWADAKTNAEGLTAVSGGTWRLPSKDDWQNMFVGCAVDGDATVPDANNEMDPIAGFKAKIAATGITWKSTNYWSSTEGSSPLAWLVRVKLDDGDAVAAFSQSPIFLTMAVLGCLAF